MVATLLAVRLRSQFSSLKANVWSAVGVGLLALFMLPVAVLAALLLSWTGSTPELRPVVMVLAGSVLIVAWLLGSVLFFALDDSVAPSRLCLLPLRPGQLSLPLVITDLATLPGILTLIVTVGLIGGWATGAAELVAAVIATLLGLLTGLTSGRILVTALTGILSNRRSRDLMYVVIVLLMVGLAWLPSLIASSEEVTFALSPEILAPMADALVWTPFGAPWGIPGAVAAGAWGLAGLRLLLTVCFFALLWWIWSWQLGRVLVSPLPSSGSAEEQASWPWLDRLLPDSPAGAIAARILRHHRRDPRRFLSFIMISLLPLFLILVQRNTSHFPIEGGLPWLAVALVTWVSGLSSLQDTSYDGSALWTHAVSGIRGRDDRLGRLIGNAVLLCPSLCLTAVVATWLTDQWAVLPALLGLGLMALLSGMGIGLFISVFLNGTLPPPGSNPFASSMKGQGAAFLAVLLHSLGMSVIIALCVLLVLGLKGTPWLGWLFLVAGPPLGVAAASGLCHWAGRCIDTRWPELVTAVTYEK